jgi:hypothetical protein
MAQIRLNPQKPVDTGLTQTYNAGLTTTDTFLVRNSGLVLLDFLKTGANACTVSVIPQRTYRGKTQPTTTFVVPATTGHVSAGVFAPDFYNDVNGDLYFTLSEVTGLTVAIFDLATP